MDLYLLIFTFLPFLSKFKSISGKTDKEVKDIS